LLTIEHFVYIHSNYDKSLAYMNVYKHTRILVLTASISRQPPG